MATNETVGPAPTHPRPNGPMVTFYLGKSIRGCNMNEHGQMEQIVNLNGYKYPIKFGARNTVPKEVYEVFLNAQSRSRVPDMERAQKAPRPMQGIGGSGYVKWETECDYELELIKEGA